MSETLLTADAPAPVEGAPVAGTTPPVTPPAAPAAGEQGTGEQGAATEQGGQSSEPGTAEGTDSQSGEGADSVAGAPEAYADFETPEGVTLNTELTAKFKDIAKGLNLNQDAAQSVFNLGLELVAQAGQQQVDAIRETQAEWLNATKTDAEIGGDKLQTSLAVAHKARDTFASDGLKTLLDQTGLGNHPEVIRLFAKVGQAISEDKLVTRNGQQPTARKTAKSFYEKTPGMTD